MELHDRHVHHRRSTGLTKNNNDDNNNNDYDNNNFITTPSIPATLDPISKHTRARIIGNHEGPLVRAPVRAFYYAIGLNVEIHLPWLRPPPCSNMNSSRSGAPDPRNFRSRGVERYLPDVTGVLIEGEEVEGEGGGIERDF